MKAKKVVHRGESQWLVSLGKKQVGRRVRVWGSTKEEAERRAAEKLEELREHGHAQSSISATHRAIMVEWRERLTPEQMVAAFVAFESAQLSTRTVRECVADYVAAKTTADERGRRAWSVEQEKPALSRLNRFLATFGDAVMGALIPGVVEDFIAAQGGSAANYHRVLRALFSHARRHRWIIANPFEEMGKTPEHDGEAKEIMQPAKFAKMLRIAAGIEDGERRREPLLAAFVLGGLAGLRTAEVQRLTWERIDLTEGRIELNRVTTRKRGLRGRFVELEPAALAWLRTLTPGDPGGRVVSLTDKNFRDARTAISRKAGIRTWPDNILRRSFASYDLALNENGAKTAARMGHTDAETTFAKYRVPATRAAALEWNSLTPEKVGGVKNVVAFVAA
jgi:integrase